MTKGYQFYEWRPGIPITDKEDKTQSEEDEIYSSYEENHDDVITKNGEDEESIKEETCEDEHPS